MDDTIMGREPCNKEDCNYYRVKTDKIHCPYKTLCEKMEKIVRCWDFDIAERAEKFKRKRARMSQLKELNKRLYSNKEDEDD